MRACITEASLSARACALARPYLLLQFAALEGGTHTALAMSDLPRAAADAAACRALVERFPATLAAQRPGARLACGLYAHAVGRFDAAAAHFLAAEQARARGCVLMLMQPPR